MPRYCNVLEGSTVTLSIKYLGNYFYVKFIVMLISCVLSIFNSKLLLVSQLRILILQFMRAELSLLFSGRVNYNITRKYV